MAAEHMGAGRGEPRLLLQDIAAELGVSVATVSRVRNGRPDVSAATRALVSERLRQLQYRDARAAPGAAPATGLVGVSAPKMTGGYFSEILAGITTALDARDARPLIGETGRDPARELDLFKRFGPGAVDGVILILPVSPPARFAAFAARGYPLVVVDPIQDVPDPLHSVVTGHLEGAVAATDHLLDLGHRRIGIVTGPPGELASQARLDGYRLALLKRGLREDPALCRHGNFEFDGGFDAASSLLALPEPERPTAIFAFSDAMAAGAVRAAARRGLALPRQLSIMGFDDAELARYLTPALTTVHQPLPDLGRAAVETLYRLRAGQAPESPRTVLATRLVVRDSTAPPPSPEDAGAPRRT